MDEDRGEQARVNRFTIEALVAAGPRKSLEDYKEDVGELCEDAAGYRCLGDFSVFWICDGTSNSNTLPRHLNQPGFNSRVLACDLGQSFGSLCANSLIKGGDPKAHLPRDMFEAVCRDWQTRLVKYLAEIESEGALPKLLDRMPKMGDGSYRMKWSSTILGGIYNESGKTLDLLSIGDCAAVVVGKTPQKVAPKETCGIILATIRSGERREVEVASVQVEAGWEHFEGVTCFMAFSDGMAKDLHLLLTELSDSLLAKTSIDDIRAHLVSAGALTYDDRSMVIGRLEASEAIGESNAKGWLTNALLSVRRAFARKVE